MLAKSRGYEPHVEGSAFVAPTAALVGRVTVGSDSRVMFGAVLDSEGSRVEVGGCVIVCENAVLRATAEGGEERPVLVGDRAFVGPHAKLLGCAVEPCSYIATGATVLHGATVRSGGAVAVGALVHANSVVPEEFFVPPNCIAVGDPLQVFAPGDPGVADAIRQAGFARSAFGVTSGWEARKARYARTAEVRSREFGSHANDSVLDV